MDHHFTGDSKLLNATIDRRTEIRKALTSLQQELQRLEGYPVQVTASIKFNVLGPAPKEHVYAVDVTDTNFDSDLFARTKVPASNSADGRPVSVASSDHDSRPAKRARTDGSIVRNGSISELSTVQRVDDLHSFMKTWHDEWTRQGGWLFDSINGIGKVQKSNQDHLDKKLDTLQDILGLSINSACATNMTELNNISKLIPWLEHCRKTNADKVQAREEKWRSSSATFHDQSRKEREAAEARLEKKLEAQRQILIKLAEVNGIDVDEEEDDDEKHSEASLGAQLTAELNSEAQRAERASRNESNTISID